MKRKKNIKFAKEEIIDYKVLLNGKEVVYVGQTPDSAWEWIEEESHTANPVVNDEYPTGDDYRWFDPRTGNTYIIDVVRRD